MTINITNERIYIDCLGCCVWYDGSEYNYQDMLGYKTFKTLNGLNRKLAKDCKMANIPVVVCC